MFDCNSGHQFVYWVRARCVRLCRCYFALRLKALIEMGSAAKVCQFELIAYLRNGCGLRFDLLL